MKVKSCSAKETVKTEPKRLSFEEIKKEEGIYSTSQASSTRLIVVKFAPHDETVVLFYYAYTNSLQAAGAHWGRETFVKIEDEEVCFEIRKKGA